MKLYVKESTEKTVDGDRIKVIKTYESKPGNFHYVVWVK